MKATSGCRLKAGSRRLAAIAAITAIAALARLYGLDWQPMDADEAMHLHPLDLGDAIAFDLRNNPPLFRLLVQWVTRFDLSSEWARLVPFFAGTATVPALFILARRHLGTTSSLVAAAVLACHPWHIRHSQTLRSFALLTLLVTVSYLLGEVARGRSKGKGLAGQSVAQMAALLTHYLAAPAMVLEAGVTAFKDGWKRALLLVAGPATVLLLLLPAVLAGAESKVTEGSNLAGPGIHSFLRGLPTAFFARGGLSLAIALCALGLGLYHRSSRPFVLHGLALVAVVAAAGFFIPVEVRYCLPALPFLLMGSCHGAVESMARWRAAGKTRAALAGLACALVAWGGIVFPLPLYYVPGAQPHIAGYHPDLNRVEEDLDALAAEIAGGEEGSPATVVIGLGGPQHHRLALALHGGQYPAEAELADLAGASVLSDRSFTLVNLDQWPPPDLGTVLWRRSPPNPGFQVIAPAPAAPAEDGCRQKAAARGAILLDCPGRLEISSGESEGRP